MVAEVVHGAPYRFTDPARFSLAHGGKDRHHYPVPIKVYDETIRVMKSAVQNARLTSLGGPLQSPLNPAGLGLALGTGLQGSWRSWNGKSYFIVTNMSRPAERVVAFYNKRGTAEQWIKEGKGAVKWTRLSCRTFAANAVRLQLHALAYNLGNFLRTLATPEPIKDWSLSSLKEKLIKIGAKVISHGRSIAFQMAEVAIPRHMFQEILRLIAELRPKPPPAPA